MQGARGKKDLSPPARLLTVSPRHSGARAEGQKAAMAARPRAIWQAPAVSTDSSSSSRRLLQGALLLLRPPAALSPAAAAAAAAAAADAKGVACPNPQCVALSRVGWSCAIQAGKVPGLGQVSAPLPLSPPCAPQARPFFPARRSLPLCRPREPQRTPARPRTRPSLAPRLSLSASLSPPGSAAAAAATPVAAGPAQSRAGREPLALPPPPGKASGRGGSEQSPGRARGHGDGMARIADAFPLHLLVWHNRHQALDSELRKGQHDVEMLDPRARTPLELAVSLGNLESARVLLRHNANVGRENANGWTVLQEAVSTGDPEMVQLVLQYRDYQRATQRLAGIPELLNKLRSAPDFYVEMKWEFTSWVPLVSKMCPSDVYRVWKRGENLRVDTTLLGFEHMTWQRGRRSYIFKGEEENAVVMEVDHDKQVVYTEMLSLALHEPELMLAAMQPSEEHVASRLTSPIVSTHLDTKNIAFERNKSGIWGWRSEKMETISGYEAKVYSATNVELVIKTRTEHLSDQDKTRNKGSKTPFQSFLGIAQQHAAQNGAPVLQSASPTNPTAITPEEYFDPNFNLETRNIGRPIEMSSKVQRFKATLWLCEDHPLSLVEQVTPIIDLMAISNAHFAKLRDFITLKLPPGFPVKIEIPLFHVLNARITFSNLCGCDEPLSSVRICTPTNTPGSTEEPTAGAEAVNNTKVYPFPCEVDPSVFEVPQGYTMLGAGRTEPMRDEDDDLLQFAIQQSLLDAGTETDQVTIWEALTNTRPGSNPPSYDEELQLERAIQESMFLQSGPGPGTGPGPDIGPGPGPPGPVESGGGNSAPPPESSPALSTNGGSSSALPPPYPSFDEQLRLAMELSSREQEERERQRREEEEELQRILQLSLTEK